MIDRDLIRSKLKGSELVLKPNQEKLSIPIIDRIYRKMKHGLKFQPIHVSSDKLIIDGHHRYVSSILCDSPIEEVSNYPKPSNLNEFDWDAVEFVDEDWDTPSKVKMLNEEDAKYNGMEIADIADMLTKRE